MSARVLVVHGDPFTLRSLVGTLRADGFVVEAATSGEAALERCAREVPAVVFTGALLPGIDAWTFVERLHAAPRTATVPCMLFTTLQGLGDLHRAFALGFDDVVPRPCEAEALRARVRSVLARSSAPRDLQASDQLHGLLPARGLPPLLRLLAAQRRSGRLELERDDPTTRCQLRLHDGRLVDAHIDVGVARRGAEAVLSVLTWSGGTFVFHAEAAEPAVDARLRRVGSSH